MAFSPHNFKILSTTLFWIGKTPFSFHLKIGRNYVSIIIPTVSSITIINIIITIIIIIIIIITELTNSKFDKRGKP